MTDTQAPKLKPCPFCGNEAIQVKVWTEFDRTWPGPIEYQMSSVECPCGASVETIDKWNTRTSEALEAENKRLRELVPKAFNEGVGAGMADFQTSRGGVTWEDSRSRKALEGE